MIENESNRPAGNTNGQFGVVAIPCGFLSIAANGLVEDANQTFLDMTGFTRAALLGTRFPDMLTMPGKIFYSTQFAPLLQMQGAVREVAFDLKRAGQPALSVLLNAVVGPAEDGVGNVTRMAIFDATQRRRYERDLLQSRKHAERLAAVIACSGDAVLSLNLQGFVDSWNAGAELLFGTSRAAALGQPVLAVMPLVRPAQLSAVIDRLKDGIPFESIELEVSSPGRADRCVLLTASVIRDPMDQVTGVSIIARDMTERREAQQRLLHASLHDALTGLPNRVLFADRISQCIDRQRQSSQSTFAVLFLDLDRFKFINDSLGHNTGDKLLIRIADQLRACLAADPTISGVVARMGGDEYTVLLEEPKTLQRACAMADRIAEALNKAHIINGREIFVSASVGIAFGNTEYTSAEQVLRDADAALYRAKTRGKARYAVFDAEMHAAAVATLEMEHNLRHALDRQELLLHYQPLIALADGRLSGFEALVRWRHNGRLISPGDFIPMAEDMGLIVPIGRWVLEEACRQLAQWTAATPAARDLTMAVNVSRKQFADADLVPHVRRVIGRFGIPPGSLKLEITESVMMESNERSGLDVLAQIKQTGAMLAMDDFGTGYSSLSCLHRFPIDVLKLDRSFVADMNQSRDASAVVSSVIGLAHKLGLVVVAEGLEQPEQVEYLRGLHCDIGQGYYFSKPLPAEQAETFITQPQGHALAA